MPNTTVKHRLQSFAEKAKIQAQKQKSTPSLLTSKKEKTLTKKQLEDIHALRQLRYNDLLNCARSDDMAVCIVFPTADRFELPLKRIYRSLEDQVELLDIFHYLEKRKENLSFALTRDNFGPALGIDLPRSTLYKMLQREDEVCPHNRPLRTASILRNQLTLPSLTI
jgi:hypothetical protein